MPLLVYLYNQFGKVEPQLLYVEELSGAGLPKERKVLQQHKITAGMQEYTMYELMSKFPFDPKNLPKED